MIAKADHSAHINPFCRLNPMRHKQVIKWVPPHPRAPSRHLNLLAGTGRAPPSGFGSNRGAGFCFCVGPSLDYVRAMSATATPIISERTLKRADLVALDGTGKHHLIDCDLDEADLARLDLTGWSFERCSLRHTDLSGAKLGRSTWRGCKAPFANLIGADLEEAHISACDFNNASFRRANIGQARIVSTRMTGADLHMVRGMDFTFEEVLLIGARLPGLSFRKEKLVRLDMAQAELTKADFRGAVFEGCSLREANLDGAQFSGADLRGADLGGLQLEDARVFRGAILSREQAEQLLSGWGLLIR